MPPVVFVDLGAYRGATIKAFRASKFFFPGAKIYAWECNPLLSKIEYGEDVEKINAAAWICDGNVEFYLSRQRPESVQGSSVYKEKKTGDLDRAHPVSAPCIDFAKWLVGVANQSSTSSIIVKMNIEGAEYDVLEHLISTGTMRLVDRLFIQWHHKKCGISQARHDALVKKLEAFKGLTIHTGYADLKGVK